MRGRWSPFWAAPSVVMAGALVAGAPPQAEIHRAGNLGFFRVVLTLPEGSPAPGRLLPQVEAGEVGLLSVQRPGPSGGLGTMTLLGCFRKPGLVRLKLVVPGGTSGREVVFQIPQDGPDHPEIRDAWRLSVGWTIRAADPEESDPLSSYWRLIAAPRLGGVQGEPPARRPMGADREPPDLYSLFSGAAAIQESLQLDLLRVGNQASEGGVPVPLSSLKGPGVASHPFASMLAGRSPQLPALARLVPGDQYGVFFSDIRKQIELGDLMEEWGGSLLRWMSSTSQDFKVQKKITRQLCLESSWLTRMFGDRVIADMAFTGNDPFLKEGTAFTVLFSLKDRARFVDHMEKRYHEAVQAGARRSTFTAGGRAGVAVVNGDRSLSSHLLLLGDVAIVSNSLQGIERILDAEAGRQASLAVSDDFRYMRTLFPQGSPEEDVFIYLSDAHIRALVGPRWKIGEARRVQCAGNLSLLGSARCWFQAEQHREPSLEELVSGGYLPEKSLTCPDGGTYGMGGDGTPQCSIHNHLGWLTPLAEIPLTHATPGEAQSYQAFVRDYDRYWTQFFDPIGIRVKLGEKLRIQTCILPLIANSWYDGLASLGGPSAGSIGETLVLPRTVASLRARIAPEWLGMALQWGRGGGGDVQWLGNEISLNLCDGQVLFTLGGLGRDLMGGRLGRRPSLAPIALGYLAAAFNLPTYLAVQVKDPVQADAAIPGLFRALAPREGRRSDVSADVYDLEGGKGGRIHVVDLDLFVLHIRLYCAVIGDRMVIASRRDILVDLMAASARGAAHDGNLELSVYRSAFKELEESIRIFFQEDQRKACHSNLPLAGILMGGMGVTPDQFPGKVQVLRGYAPFCPSGGHYDLDVQGAATCSVHGSLRHPRQPLALESETPAAKLLDSLKKLNIRLTFTPEGLMTLLELQRTR